MLIFLFGILIVILLFVVGSSFLAFYGALSTHFVVATTHAVT